MYLNISNIPGGTENGVKDVEDKILKKKQQQANMVLSLKNADINKSTGVNRFVIVKFTNSR
jgi:hypothetical protein